MTLWLDAQLSPRLAQWMAETFGVECVHVRDLGLRHAEDAAVFHQAREAGTGTVVMTKDEDFVDLVERLRVPPQVLWVRCGNMSNARFKSVLLGTLRDAIALLENGEPIVEINQAV